MANTKPKGEKPKAQEVTKLKDFLKRKGVQDSALTGVSPDLSRAAIVEALRQMCRGLKKA